MAPCMYQDRVHLYIVVHSLAHLLGYGMLYLSVLERQVPWTVLRKTSRTTYRFLLTLTSIHCNVYMSFICIHKTFKHFPWPNIPLDTVLGLAKYNVTVLQRVCYLNICISHKLPVLLSIQFCMTFLGMDTRLFAVLSQQLLIVSIS